MVPIPVPNRVVLDVESKNPNQVLRDLARFVAEETQLHPVGVLDCFSPSSSDVIRSQILPGVTFFDGCLTGVETPCFMVIRLVHPVALEEGTRAPTRLVFCLLSSDGDRSAHVQRVSRLARLLRQKGTLQAIEQADRPGEVTALFLAAGHHRTAA